MMPPTLDDESEFSAPSGAWNDTRPEYQAFARFARLTRECRTLERRVKELKAQMEELAFQLREYLGASGFHNVNVEGYTIFLRRDIYVRARDGAKREAVIGALKRNGMAHFVHEEYSTASLSAHIRQLEEIHEPELKSGELVSVGELLPAEVLAVLNIDPKFSVIALETPHKR